MSPLKSPKLGNHVSNKTFPTFLRRHVAAIELQRAHFFLLFHRKAPVGPIKSQDNGPFHMLLFTCINFNLLHSHTVVVRYHAYRLHCQHFYFENLLILAGTVDSDDAARKPDSPREVDHGCGELGREEECVNSYSAVSKMFHFKCS